MNRSGSLEILTTQTVFAALKKPVMYSPIIVQIMAQDPPSSSVVLGTLYRVGQFLSARLCGM